MIDPTAVNKQTNKKRHCNVARDWTLIYLEKELKGEINWYEEE